MTTIAALASCTLAEERYISDNDRFPGWKGELPVDVTDQLSQALSQKTTGKTTGFGENGKVPRNPLGLTQLRSQVCCHSGPKRQ